MIALLSNKVKQEGQFYLSFLFSSQQDVGDEHYAKADEERVGRAAFVPMRVGLGDHFIADDVEHGATRECQSKRKDRGCNADRKITEEGSQDLDQARKSGKQEGSAGLDPCGKHRTDDDHALGDVLKRNAARDDQCLRGISRSKANACGNSLGEIVDRDRRNKQKNAAQIGIVMLFDIHTCKLM